MKKYITMLLVAVMCISMTACGGNKDKVIALASGQTWFYNGGTENSVNSITFGEEEANIYQIYYDGNGKHLSDLITIPYDVDDSNIILTLADGSELAIPYVLEGEGIKLGAGDYFTISEVDTALQGNWNNKENSYIAVLNFSTAEEYNINIDNGNIVYENASLAHGATNGEYYYYGPYNGTYVIDQTGLVTDVKNDYSWGFSIIDGEVVLCRYDHICIPGDGLKGENGYSF